MSEQLSFRDDGAVWLGAKVIGAFKETPHVDKNTVWSFVPNEAAPPHLSDPVGPYWIPQRLKTELRKRHEKKLAA